MWLPRECTVECLRAYRIFTGLVVIGLFAWPASAEKPAERSKAYDGLPGFTQPLQRVTLNAIRTGRVSAYLADEGDVLPRDGVLIELADQALTARVAKARYRAESTVAIEIAETELKTAERELERLMALEQASSASDKELQDARSEYQLAKLKLENARFEHALAQAEYEVELRSHEQLTIRVPMKAYIVKRVAEVGQVVELGDELVEVAQLDVLKVEVDCPLNVLPRLRVGCAVHVEPVEKTWKPRTGHVAMVSRVADAPSQTARVIIRVDNNDGAWLSGMRVSVQVPSQSEACLAQEGTADTSGRQQQVDEVTGQATAAVDRGIE
jgi:RND family efflux transporter MFP subunit